MDLITCAYYGEAQSLIEHFELKKSDSYLFEGKDFDVLLTGEGIIEASSKTSYYLGKKQYSRVINLGIAGALKGDLSSGKVIKIRSIFAEDEFKSFTNPSGEWDLISAKKRVNQSNQDQIKGIAELVDREAWGIAFAAKTFQVDFICYKIISDHLEQNSCEIVQENKDHFSAEILKTYLSLSVLGLQNNEAIFPFYFTHTQKHRFQKLKDLYEKKFEKNYIESSSYKSFLNNEEKRTSKEKGQNFLNQLEDEIFPIEAKIKKDMKIWLQKNIFPGINLKTDPKLESDSITVEVKIKNRTDILRVISDLEKITIEDYQKLMEGSSYVE